MDQRERIDDFPEALRVAMEGYIKGVWTCLPCIVQSFDPVLLTVTAQPAIKVRVRKADGTSEMQALPLLLDVPVVFPRGGNFILTFPITAGMTALVVFADRCIDGWWQLSGVQNPPEFRMHDLSDGFAIVGPISKPGTAGIAGGVNTNNAQLRANNGASYIELTPGGGVNIVAPGGFTVNGATTITGATSITGAASITGNVTATGTGVFGGHSVGAHTHGNVTHGTDFTATPLG